MEEEKNTAPEEEQEAPEETRSSSGFTQPLIWGVIVLVAAVGTAALLLSSGINNEAETDGEVLAYVNDKEITKEDISAITNQMRMQYEAQDMDVESDPELKKELRQNALLSEIRQSVLLQYAEEQGLDINTEEIEEEYDRSVEQFQGGEEEMLEGMAEMNITQDDLRADIQTMLLLQKVAKEEADTDITEDDVQERYDQISSMQQQQGEEGMELPPLEEIEGQLRDELEQQKMVAALENIFAQQYPETEIEIVDPELQGVEQIIEEAMMTPEAPAAPGTPETPETPEVPEEATDDVGAPDA